MDIQALAKLNQDLVYKKSNIDKATILRKRTNDLYDLSNGMVNIHPFDTERKFAAGQTVLLDIPIGNKQATEIIGKSDLQEPEEELDLFDEDETGTIYLACPEENLIRVYSTNGTPGTNITTGNNSQYNIATDGIYLYCGYQYAYILFLIKSDGTSERTIANQSRYYSSNGLAVDPTITYLYQIDGYESNYISRITISDGTIEDTWKNFNTGFDFNLNPTDLCGNSDYLFVAGNIYSGGGQIVVRVFDYSGNFVREISFSSTDTYKITADDTNIYLYSSTSVEIYTIAGVFVRSISENNIQAVAVKDGKIYIITEESGGAT